MLNKTFSKKELIILSALLIVILAACYYYFIYVPVNDSIERVNSQITDLENEDSMLQLKLVRLKKTERELEALKKGKKVSIMPSYNGARLEVNFLHDLMAPLGTYDFEFTDVTRSGDLIRRNFILSFESEKYNRVVNIFKALYACKYRVLINDLTYESTALKTKGKHSHRRMSLSGTFYETMAGAVEDEGLPDDQNKKAALKKAAEEAEKTE